MTKNISRDEKGSMDNTTTLLATMTLKKCGIRTPREINQSTPESPLGFRFWTTKNDYEALHPRQNRISDIDTVFFRAVVCMLDVSGLDGEEIHLNKCSFHFDAKRTIASSELSA